MKTTLALLVSSLSLVSSAHLIYDASTQALGCPTASGAFCLTSSPDLIVSCANSVGTLSKCTYGTTCSQTSEAAGDAACLTTPKGTYTDTIVDSEAEDCECDEPNPPPVSSKSWAPPLPSSSAPSSFSRFANVSSSTPVAPIKPSTHYIPPPPASSTPVGPANVSSSSIRHGTGTGTGYPVPTSRVTTLNSSWKPTLTAESTRASTTVSPAQATSNSASSNAGNALAALGVVGAIAALL